MKRHFRCYRCNETGHFASDCVSLEAWPRAVYIAPPTSAGASVVGKRARRASAHLLTGAAAGGQHVLGVRKGASEHVIARVSPQSASEMIHLEEREEGVYVLQLSRGGYYVGKSANVAARLEQHRTGGGASACAAGFLRRVPPMTPPQADLEMWERAETLARMRAHGVANVRGWMFTTPELTEAQQRDAFVQVCERFDLCRRCGREGHFATGCGEAKRSAHWA